MTYTCFQGNDSDCGFAALKMLLANKANNKSYLYIRKPSKKKEYTFYELIRYAKKYGFQLTSYEIPVEDFKSIPLGSLVLLKENHMVYLKKIGRRRVTYFDPALGKMSVPHKEFMNKWRGIVMECVNALEADDLDIPKPKLIPVWMDAIYYSLIAVIFVSLMTGFYLINDQSSVVLTMVFLLLFAIAQLVENWYIIKELKYFDRRYLSLFFSQKKNQNMDKYKDYTEYKQNYFIVSKLLVSSLIMIVAFGVLLCINDYRNTFVFIILLLVKTLDNLLFSRKEEKDTKDISTIESLAFDCERTLTHELTRANSLASKVALNKSLKRVAYMFLCLCLAVLMMSFSNVTSTNFVIFHFGIYVLVSDAFDHVIKFFSSSTDRKIKKARFLDDCDL